MPPKDFMDPAYLHALMHGEIIFKKKGGEADGTVHPKSKFENDLEKEIDTFVDGINFDEDPNHVSFQSPQLKRQKLKLELKEATKLPELFEPVTTAIEVIFSDGPKYLSEDEYNTLVVELVVSTEQLANVGIEETLKKDLQTIAGISDVSIKALEKIAVAKFEEERFVDCQGLFCLLSLLVPGSSEYWFRLGIAAQKNENFELASKAYAVTLNLNPNNIGSRLFAAQCFIQRSLLDDAKTEISQAKETIREGGVDKIWVDLLGAIESTITH